MSDQIDKEVWEEAQRVGAEEEGERRRKAHDEQLEREAEQDRITAEYQAEIERNPPKGWPEEEEVEGDDEAVPEDEGV